jgi:hypothetical protein
MKYSMKEIPRQLKRKYNFNITYTGLMYYRTTRSIPLPIRIGKEVWYDVDALYQSIKDSFIKQQKVAFIKRFPKERQWPKPIAAKGRS